MGEAQNVSFGKFSAEVESEFQYFCEVLKDLPAFERGSWQTAERELNGSHCENLRGLLLRLVSPKRIIAECGSTTKRCEAPQSGTGVAPDSEDP
jgi:hypothetical protein